MRERAVGYIRVSTQGQVKDGYSLSYQVEEIERYCAAHGLELLDIYKDEGISGAKVDEDELNIEREGLEELLLDLKWRAVKCVVVLNTSRLWRADIVKVLIHRELKRHHVDVRAIEQPSYSIYAHDPSDFLINGMMELLDQYQRLEIAMKLSRGRRKKAQQGEYAGGKAAYGYVSIKGQKALQEFVKFVKKLCKRGMTPIYGLEDVGGYGRTLAVYLIEHKQKVKEVNSALSFLERKSYPTTQKSDSWDAECVAKILLNKLDILPDANPQDIYWTIGQIVTRRNGLIKAQISLKNQLHAQLSYHYPSYHKFFSDLDGKCALAFWEKFPAQHHLNGWSVDELAVFLQKSSNNACSNAEGGGDFGSRTDGWHVPRAARFPYPKPCPRPTIQKEGDRVRRAGVRPYDEEIRLSTRNDAGD